MPKDSSRAAPSPWTYIATAQAFDAEMHARIKQHQSDRVPGWLTVEAPVDMPDALACGPAPAAGAGGLPNALVEQPHAGQHGPCQQPLRHCMATLDRTLPAPTVLVSNEIGLGIVPDNALARAFRDEAGRLHQQVAAPADRVVLVVAGLPTD